MRYDYVIVGGGSAGSTLASRLSEDPNTSVCLMEAGGAGKSLLVRTPAAVIAMLPGRPKINNWAFETLPQTGPERAQGVSAAGQGAGRFQRNQRDALCAWAPEGL